MVEPATNVESSRGDSPSITLTSDDHSPFAGLIGDTSDLAALERKKIATDTAATGEMLHQLRQDRSRAQNFLDREGVGPNDLQKWDAEAEKRKYETNPIESFGSLASVFAIAASAFTKTPMINALNGSAAAMNAIRERDDEGYKRAFEAWKANTDLAIKRHNMMHQDYQDAISLMTTDLKLGEAKLRADAVRFGDQKTLFYLEHFGATPEMFQMLDARNRAAEGVQKLVRESDEYTLRKHVFDTDPRRYSKNPQEQMQAFNDAMGIKTDAEQRWNTQYWAAHPSSGDPKTDYENWLAAYKEFNAARYPYRGITHPGSKAELVLMLAPEIAHDHPDWSPAQVAVEANRQAEAATTKRSVASAHQETIDKKSQEYQTAGMSKTNADIRAERFVKLSTATPSGNRLDQIQQRVDQIDLADGIIGDAEGLLKKHNAITGLGGKLTRPAEVLTDVFGGSASDRKQFESFINELQLLMPRILTDSQGRPLGAEAAHIGTVIRGLNIGDTTANTTRALLELRKQLTKLKQAAKKRMDSDAVTETPASAPAQAPASSDVPRWQRFSVPETH